MVKEQTVNDAASLFAERGATIQETANAGGRAETDFCDFCDSCNQSSVRF